MSVLRVAFRLILGVNIGVHDASSWTGVIGRGLPRTVYQFHLPEFFENHATQIVRRPDRPQAALALAAILIAEPARLAQAIPTQPVRAKQPRKIFIDSADRLFIGNRRPKQAVHVFHRLDLCLNDTHPTSRYRWWRYLQASQYFVTQ